MIEDFVIRKPSLGTLIKILNGLYGFDITRKGRRREYIYARKVYSKIARGLGFTYQSIAGYIGANHATILHHVKTFHVVEEIDIENHDKCIEILKAMTYITEELIEENPEILQGRIVDISYKTAKARAELNIAKKKLIRLKEENESLVKGKKIIEFLSGWTDGDMDDFIEYRLKPYHNMIRNRSIN